MSEPHPDGGRGKSSSSEACASNNHHHRPHHHHHSTQSTIAHAATTFPVISLDAATTSCRSGPSCTSTSPISPPTSPALTSCLTSQTSPNHPVDMLAFRLRNQSLIPLIPSDSHGPKPSSALSPTSLLDDDYVAPSMVPDDIHATPMQVDDAEDDCIMPIPSRFQRRSYRHGVNDIAVPPPPSGPSDVMQPSPVSNDSFPATESGSSSTGRTLYGPTFVIDCPEIEVDEGYCEETDDRAWLESVMSLRQASGPGGVKKRYGLKYRTSNEAASRCQNAVHSVPRMRRRDKTKKRHRRLESDASSSASAAVVAAPQ